MFGPELVGDLEPLPRPTEIAADQSSSTSRQQQLGIGIDLSHPGCR